MAAATIAGAQPSDWEVYPPTVVLSRVFGRSVKQLDEPKSRIALFPDSVLIQLAKGVIAADNGVKDPSLLAPSFTFCGPLVGPIGKEEFIKAFGGFNLKVAFPDLDTEFTNFRVDPYEPYRVWVDGRGSGTWTGPFLGKEGNGARYEGPPEAISFTFDDQGICTRLTAGTVMDPTVGNTGGLGGVFGIFYATGQALPGLSSRPLPQLLARAQRAIAKPITGIDVDDFTLTPKKKEGERAATARDPVPKVASPLSETPPKPEQKVDIPKIPPPPLPKLELSKVSPPKIAPPKSKPAPLDIAKTKNVEAKSSEDALAKLKEEAVAKKKGAEERIKRADKEASERRKKSEAEKRSAENKAAEEKKLEAEAKRVKALEAKKAAEEKRKREAEERRQAAAEAKRAKSQEAAKEIKLQAAQKGKDLDASRKAKQTQAEKLVAKANPGASISLFGLLQAKEGPAPKKSEQAAELAFNAARAKAKREAAAEARRAKGMS